MTVCETTAKAAKDLLLLRTKDANLSSLQGYASSRNWIHPPRNAQGCWRSYLKWQSCWKKSEHKKVPTIKQLSNIQKNDTTVVLGDNTINRGVFYSEEWSWTQEFRNCWFEAKKQSMFWNVQLVIMQRNQRLCPKTKWQKRKCQKRNWQKLRLKKSNHSVSQKTTCFKKHKQIAMENSKKSDTRQYEKNQWWWKEQIVYLAWVTFQSRPWVTGSMVNCFEMIVKFSMDILNERCWSSSTHHLDGWCCL